MDRALGVERFSAATEVGLELVDIFGDGDSARDGREFAGLWLAKYPPFNGSQAGTLHQTHRPR